MTNGEKVVVGLGIAGALYGVYQVWKALQSEKQQHQQTRLRVQFAELQLGRQSQAICASRQEFQRGVRQVALLETQVGQIARSQGRIEGELTIVREQVLGDGPSDDERGQASHT